MNAHRLRWPIAVIVLVALGGFTMITVSGIGDNLIYYWSPTDLHAAGEKAYDAPIRLGGMVAGGTLVTRSGLSEVRFDVTDGKQVVHVRSTGVPPQMLREHIGVVVEGTMTRQGHFEGKRLMVSHDNQYQKPEGHADLDADAEIKKMKGMSP